VAAVFGEGAERLAPCLRVRVPKLPAPRPPPGRQASAVATERPADRADLTLLVSVEGVQELTAPPVPDIYGAVTSRRELSAVAGAERHCIRRTDVVNCAAQAGEHVLAGR